MSCALRKKRFGLVVREHASEAVPDRGHLRLAYARCGNPTDRQKPAQHGFPARDHHNFLQLCIHAILSRHNPTALYRFRVGPKGGMLTEVTDTRTVTSAFITC